MLLDGLFIRLPSFRRGFAGRLFDAGDFLETDGQPPCADLSQAVHGHQQGSLQEAQSQRQIDMEGRRERVALIERLLDTAAGLGQARVIYRDAHQLSGTVSQCPFEDGSKQLLRLPLTTRVQKVLRAPTAMLAAVGPNDA